VLLANWGSMPVACISNPSASGQFASKPYITTDENVLKNLSSSLKSYHAAGVQDNGPTNKRFIMCVHYFQNYVKWPWNCCKLHSTQLNISTGL
jgi:hypothetical protein